MRPFNGIPRFSQRLITPLTKSMSSLTNICLHCGEAFEGRANKKFCSEAHKNQYHYENREVPQSEPATVVPLMSRVVLSPKPNSMFPSPRRVYLREENPELQADELEEDWLALQEAEEEAQEEAKKQAEKARTLHKQYSALIVKCLKVDCTELDEDNLETWIEQFDEVSEAYREHPALRQPLNQTHKRLEDLYWLRDKFRDLMDEYANQPLSWFSDKKPVYFELSTKRLTKLRQHLLE